MYYQSPTAKRGIVFRVLIAFRLSQRFCTETVFAWQSISHHAAEAIEHPKARCGPAITAITQAARAATEPDRCESVYGDHEQCAG